MCPGMALEAEQRGAFVVDDDLDPAELRVAESFGAGEAGDALAGFRVMQRLVDALPVCVAVYEQDLPVESKRLGAQLVKQFAVAGMAEPGPVVPESGIGLQRDDDALHACRAGLRETLVQPFEYPGRSCQRLAAGLAGLQPVVVRSRHIERDEEYRAVLPALMLPVLTGLSDERNAGSPERNVAGMEALPKPGKTLLRVM